MQFLKIGILIWFSLNLSKHLICIYVDHQEIWKKLSFHVKPLIDFLVRSFSYLQLILHEKSKEVSLSSGSIKKYIKFLIISLKTYLKQDNIAPNPTQYYIVWIKIEGEIFFAKSFVTSMWLKSIKCQ